MLPCYDRWLRPRPNSIWKNVENKTFIDLDFFDSGSLDEDEHTSDDEEEEAGSFKSISEPGGDENESEEDEIVTRILSVIKDQDLRRDSMARLRQLFKSTNLERLEESTTRLKESRILLEDRNFTHKTFRAYPRPMTPKQLYDALGKKVRSNLHKHLSRLTRQ